jgi:prepilin-type N-terminal cleavage/methylation domain-containing protein
MKRSGFTMIELIFVIVILGILAAVAIPRLAATRDDAKIATKVQESTQFLQEMGNYYTTHGAFARPSQMSNVKVTTGANETPSNVDLNQTGGTVTLTDGNSVACVTYTTTPGSIDGNVTVINLTTASSICAGIRKALLDKNISALSPGKTHSFGGSNVVY